MTLSITKLQNPVREYAWGSTTAIADIQGRPSPTPHPEAELWIGAHPSAPSRLSINGVERTLPEMIAESPQEILGSKVTEAFGNHLPFLFKILAACEPLSIQAHPNKPQAAAGFARDEAAGILRTAPERNYRDANHKPEVIYALTPFHLVAGFREPSEILTLAEDLALVDDFPGIDALRSLQAGSLSTSEALARLLRAWLALPTGDPSLERALQLAAGREEAVFRWIQRLNEAHPLDRGILAPMILNLIELQPGDALYTGAGILHAYLDGVGIELMANSDNVLRGALTVKNIDVDELVAILRIEPDAPKHLLAQPGDPGEARFEPPVEDFLLSRLDLRNDEKTTRQVESVEILLMITGRARLVDHAGAVELAAGEAALIPASVGSYSLSGVGDAFRATVHFARSS